LIAATRRLDPGISLLDIFTQVNTVGATQKVPNNENRANLGKSTELLQSCKIFIALINDNELMN
jgi:hypothetical protein